eukprot:SAG31_NODE_3199_length_4564_cov_18.467861_7_plen_123_part_00
MHQLAKAPFRTDISGSAGRATTASSWQEDGTREGVGRGGVFGRGNAKARRVFPLKGGDWLVGLTECRGGEQRLEEFYNNKRLVISDPPPEHDKASGVAIVLSPRLSHSVVDSGQSVLKIALG